MPIRAHFAIIISTLEAAEVAFRIARAASETASLASSVAGGAVCEAGKAFAICEIESGFASCADIFRGSNTAACNSSFASFVEVISIKAGGTGDFVRCALAVGDRTGTHVRAREIVGCVAGLAPTL